MLKRRLGKMPKIIPNQEAQSSISLSGLNFDHDYSFDFLFNQESGSINTLPNQTYSLNQQLFDTQQTPLVDERNLF